MFQVCWIVKRIGGFKSWLGQELFRTLLQFNFFIYKIQYYIWEKLEVNPTMKIDRDKKIQGLPGMILFIESVPNCLMF